MLYTRRLIIFGIMALLGTGAAGVAHALSAETSEAVSEKFTKPKEAHPLPAYTIDPNHTRVLYFVSHLGFSKTPGQFNNVAGTIRFDPARVEQSSVDVTIQTKNLSMGNDALDRKLQTSEFFNTIRFPTITFKSTKVEKTSSDRGVVEGDLTLLGVTKPVTLNVKFNLKAWNKFARADAIGFSAWGKINRSDFGLKAYLPDVGDQVTLHIEAEALEQRGKPAEPAGNSTGIRMH